MKKTDLAYIAGLFDGEGSIGIYLNQSKKTKEGIKLSHYRLQCAVMLTDEFLIHLLQMHFGGEFYIYTRRDKPIWRIVYRWSVNSKKALDFLETIIPYLKIKKPQAEIAIQFQKAIKPRGYYPLTDKEQAVREAQSILLKKMKRDSLKSEKQEMLR